MVMAGVLAGMVMGSAGIWALGLEYTDRSDNMLENQALGAQQAPVPETG